MSRARKQDRFSSTLAVSYREPTSNEPSLGTCADIAPLDRYFASLDRRVRDLVASGTGLADVASRADMPEYAEWDDYEKLHAANANRAFLAVERAGFGD